VNALDLIPDISHTDGYWLGSLSMAIATAVKEPDHKWARQNLRRALDDFLRSPLPSEELVHMLREELK